MPGCQSGFAMKLPGSSPLTNGTMIDTKTLCSRLLPFQTGKIVLHNLKLKAERILTHKKLHLTSLGVQLFGCSSCERRFFYASAEPTASFIPPTERFFASRFPALLKPAATPLILSGARRKPAFYRSNKASMLRILGP